MAYERRKREHVRIKAAESASFLPFVMFGNVFILRKMDTLGLEPRTDRL